MTPAGTESLMSHKTVMHRTTATGTTVIAFACLVAAGGIGMWLRPILPEYDLSPDSKDAVKLAMGLVSTMSALLLGLLVNSAKNVYDAARSQVTQLASTFALLDRLLTIYGQQAAEVRDRLHALIEESIQRIWLDDANLQAQSKPKNEMNSSFYVAVLRLEAHDDSERALREQAASLTLQIAQIRSLMQTESISTTSRPILKVVVLWLMMMSLAFSLIAPPNATANFAMIASAMCVSGAIFLILEMNNPFDGVGRISKEPMLNVLRQSKSS